MSNPKSDSLFVIDRQEFDPKNYWYIHGKYYNLTNYMEKHPGGKFILEKTKGQGDLSALYESYHAFSNIDNIDKYLKTFEVKFKTNTNQHQYKIDNYNIIYIPKNNIYDAYLNIAESFDPPLEEEEDMIEKIRNKKPKQTFKKYKTKPNSISPITESWPNKPNNSSPHANPSKQIMNGIHS